MQTATHTGAGVPQSVIESATVFLYALAAICGGVAGVSVASHQILHGRKQTTATVLAYFFIGLVAALLFMAFGTRFGFDTSHINDVIGYSILAGAVSTFTLASINLGSRIVLKWRGVEATLTFRQNKEDRRDDTNQRGPQS